jgi:hypothetical protein
MFALSAMFMPVSMLSAAEPRSISGRYPHLTMFNQQGECGTGAVVPWADRLWVITYGPHLPEGSDDKLYEITSDLTQIIRPESVGGTPANRMIHRESNQLLIGPYLIDADRNVRVIPPSKMFGRLTANARHLTDPANKIYYYDMEGLLYEADVRTLDVSRIYTRALPGWHGKGGYTGQGRLVLANNGEHVASTVNKLKPFQYQVQFENGGENAGVLGEWDGSTWRIIHRRQFTEITGPGGIYGPSDDKQPVWAMGWDKRSVLLLLCDEGGKWTTFRLPIADYSYVAQHGWHTEWPRIRQVVPASGNQPPKLLANMHGSWFDFPITFSAANTAGLRPIGSYLKVSGDFTDWAGRIVFGCDDTAVSGFTNKGQDTLNHLNGQSQSNLWFTTWEGLHDVGVPFGGGGPWLADAVKAGRTSEAYLFAGYTRRVLHLAHEASEPVTFTVEVDLKGDGKWTDLAKITVPAGGYVWHPFADDVAGEWVRLSTDRDAKKVTAYFDYGKSHASKFNPAMFNGLAKADPASPRSTGILRVSGKDRGTVQYLSRPVDASGKLGEPVFYEMALDMKLAPASGQEESRKFLEEKGTIKSPNFQVDAASIILTEDGKRFRLPKGDASFDTPGPEGWPRGLREIVTERSLLNAHGTFYMMPRTNSGGVAMIKPVTTHNRRITDFASWRGLTVLAGLDASAPASEHIVTSTDGKAALWLGDIDDLWKLGKPVGHGGPWANSATQANIPSDPYLMRGYDRKSLTLTNHGSSAVTFTIEVDPAGDGRFFKYESIKVDAGGKAQHNFPADFSAAWARLVTDQDTTATAMFKYE